MDGAKRSAEQLREQIAKAEEELKLLKAQLAEAEGVATDFPSSASQNSWKWPLKAEEYQRYGRQLILPAVGVQGEHGLT